MNINEEALKLHEEKRGKLEIKSRVKADTKEALSLAYTPGVAEPCLRIKDNKEDCYKYTNRWNTVAVISDGSAVLGLGNIGAEASMPVMEGKAVLFKEFANIDAIPIILATQDTKEIIDTIKNIAPSFGGINLEDISAPRCFEIEETLKKELDIPVFHDDQHGTAVVVLSGLINASKYAKKDMASLKITINGAGAAGIAIARILKRVGIKDIILCDSKGIVSSKRTDLAKEKKEFAVSLYGNLSDALINRDVFIGVSKANLLTKEMIGKMNSNPIIFAMANPIPEIMPDKAYSAGAAIVATGRSDFPNQVNNVLGFPAIFRGALDAKATQINEEMKLSASYALASLISDKDIKNKKIIVEPFDKRILPAVSEAVKRKAIEMGVVRK